MGEHIYMADHTSGIEPLLTPFQVGPLTLPNRFVMAPMTRERSPGGVPGDDVAAYYARRAAGGVGLIITEGTYIDHPTAGSSSAVPRLDASTVAAWSRVVAAVHAEGAAIFSQLWHLGAARKLGAPPFTDAPVFSPSGIDAHGKPHGRAMTDGDIAEVIAAYARSAILARDIGFDGVEVHAAHGYLIDQFLWAQTNQRSEGYGGSLVARSRFAVEVVAAIRRAVGPDYPIGFRFSQWKGTHYDARLFASPEELRLAMQPIADAGVSLFHVSVRRYWEAGFDGSELTLSGWVKRLFGLPTITVGSVGLSIQFVPSADNGGPAHAASLDRLLECYANGEFDLVALGRALVSDPNWVAKVRDGRHAELVGFSPEARNKFV